MYLRPHRPTATLFRRRHEDDPHVIIINGIDKFRVLLSDKVIVELERNTCDAGFDVEVSAWAACGSDELDMFGHFLYLVGVKFLVWRASPDPLGPGWTEQRAGSQRADPETGSERSQKTRV